MKIAALDIATNCGIAVGSPGRAPVTWIKNLGKPPDDRRFSEALVLTQSIITAHKPDLMVVEAAIGGPKASAYLIGLVAAVRAVCWNRSVRCESVHLGSVRKHFLGKALTTRHFPHLKPAAAKKAIKAEVMARCRLLGWEIETDDEADAAAAWDYACATWATGYQAEPSGGLFNGNR